MLYKYLNPNLQAIATLSPYEKRAATLTVYLVDVVKGRVVDTMFQEGARGPVHLAQSENWVVCHFKNRKAKRYEVAVMQMYEADAKVGTICPYDVLFRDPRFCPRVHLSHATGGIPFFARQHALLLYPFSLRRYRLPVARSLPGTGT